MHTPSLAVLSCTCGLVGDGVNMYFLLSLFGKTIGLCRGVLLGYSVIFLIKNVLPRKKLVIYFVISELLLFISNSSTIALWH